MPESFGSMAKEAASGGGAKVDYLEELEGWVLDERKVVTFRWLALVLSVTANAAKKMLYDFCQRQGADKVWATYLLVGDGGSKTSGKRGEQPASVEVKLVPAEALEKTRKAFKSVKSVHVYSVQAALSAPPPDVATQLWATDLEHNKEMVGQTTDAGSSLRTHRLSGVRCAAVVDVPPPVAPTPSAYVEEESPFAPRRSNPAGISSAALGTTNNNGKEAGGGGGGAAEKPKGKAIDPKDFFGGAAAAAAAAAGAKGGGKGRGKAKGGADKGVGNGGSGGGGGPKAGSIGSFFGKAAATKPSKPSPAAERDGSADENDSGQGTGDGSSKSKGSAGNGKKTEDAPAKRPKHGDTKVNGSETTKPKLFGKSSSEVSADEEEEEEEKEEENSAKKDGAVKGGDSKGTPTMMDDDDKGDEAELDNGHAEAEENNDGDGDDDDDEEEWNDDGIKTAGTKASTPKSAPNSASSCLQAKKTRTKDENTPADTSAEKKRTAESKSRRSVNSSNGAATDADDKQLPSGSKKAAKKRRVPKSKLRSQSESEGESSGDGIDAADEKKADNTRKGARGSSKGSKGGGKRKGRYDSDDDVVEDEEPQKPISGAMDKFAAKHDSGGGVKTKRTKIVVKDRMYVDNEGYMKTVREEVEVTDDDEPLQPSQTNKSRTPPPDKRANTGGDGNRAKEDLTGNGKDATKANGKSKKSKAMSSGKQAKMDSFFKKA